MSHKVLIPGGAGFVGSSLAIALKSHHPNWKIICFDNLRRRGSELNLPRFRKLGIEFVHGDIRAESDLDPLVLDVDTIIDCSAEPSVLAGFSSPRYVLQTNLVGTINLLELARKLKARLLFLSTSRVYPIAALKAIPLIETASRFEIDPMQSAIGVSEGGISESFSLAGSRSLYGATKLASELLIEEYRESYDIPTIVNRCGVLTGPWQMGKIDQGVFVLWVAAHHFQRSLKYIGYGGTGKQVRDLLHIADLVDLVHYQLENFSELNGDVLNVGGGMANSLSLLETTKLCEEITGKQIQIESLEEERSGDIPIFVTDSTEVLHKTGWYPKRNARQTLEEIYQWIIEYEDQLKPILL